MQPTTYVLDPAIQNNQTAGQVAKHGLSSHTHNHGANLPQGGAYNSSLGQQAYGQQQVYGSQPGYGAQPGYGSNISTAYGPQATTTTYTKEVDTYAQHPIASQPMMSQPMSTNTGYQAQEFDKHGKPKKQKKQKKSKKATKGTEQVIVPPGPAIVPAVVIPVIGAPPQNSAFVNPGMYQQQGLQQGPMYQGQMNRPMPAPTSGVLPPTGVQNPMTATLPINMQGLNPVTHVGGANLATQPPILSTPNSNLCHTKDMLIHQHQQQPMSGVSGNNSYSTYNTNSAYCDQGPAQQGFIQDTGVKRTVVEERKEIIGGPTVAHRQY